MAGDPNMSRYAVTFIDNHDTYRNENGEKLQNNVLAANAFILLCRVHLVSSFRTGKPIRPSSRR
ncbi:hypothetical protein [Prevotella fusca]|uniref:hypothetical protein n=1 Tax=Prevotella fusca TaxID=589436 RepID=UPI001F2A64E1|nr:hypothetical protein [Prevotella fusca]